MINRPIEYQRMAESEERHWWYKSLHNNIKAAIKKTFKENSSIKIVDAGCGTGGMLDVLKNSGYSDIQGFDLSADAIEFCKQKKMNAFLGDVVLIEQYYEKNSIDVIICNDILCYFQTLEEQQKIMTSFESVLKKGGIIILNLPAFESFSGMHDIAVGIKKRSCVDDMKQIKGGLEIEKLYCWPFTLFPLILLTRKIQKRGLNSHPDAEIKSDVIVPSKVLNNLFYFITKAERFLDLPYRYASSVFTVFKKI